MHYENCGNRRYSLPAFWSNCTKHAAMGAGCALIWSIKILKLVENNINMSYESENKTILFLLLLYVLKFKLYLIDLSLILSWHDMYQTWPSFDFVVEIWVCPCFLMHEPWVCPYLVMHEQWCVSVFPDARTMGVCPCFLMH